MSEILDAIHAGHDLLGNKDLEAVPGIENLRLEPGSKTGSHTLRWEPTVPTKNSPLARIYMRQTKTPQQFEAGFPAGGGDAELPTLEYPWTLVGESRDFGFAFVELGTLEVYDFAVAESDAYGTFQTPDVATKLLAETIPEFPYLTPPDGPPVRAYNKDGGVLLEWDDISNEEIERYEIRQGPSWAYGDRVGCSSCPSFVHANPIRTVAPYRVRAMNRHGIGSRGYSTVAGTNWLPPGRIVDTETDELPAGTPLGTLSDLTYDTTTKELRISDGKYYGTYTSSELDLISPSLRYWWNTLQVRGEDNALVDEWDFPVDSGEALFREVDEREPTHMKPGVDLFTLVDDALVFVDDLPDSQLVHGIAQLVHPYATVKIEVRFHNGSVWAAYTLSPRCSQLLTEQKMQVRITMARENLSRQLYASDMRLGSSDSPTP